MKLKSIVFSAIFLLSIGINAQTELECKTNLSNAHVATQAKNYDAAYGPWLYVKKNCPGLNLATYADGEKIMKHKIETSKGEVQLSFVNAMLDLWILRNWFLVKSVSNFFKEPRESIRLFGVK